jgi:DNA modification methylase
MSYKKFIESKQLMEVSTGIKKDLKINSMLFDFQSDIVRWALKRGRACIFADCGLGKSPMQLEWSRHVSEYTKGNVLILAPLAVSEQTKREGDKFHIDVNICRDQSGIKPGINITNYEMIEHFDIDSFDGIVLDESSILKNYTGAFRNLIIDRTRDIKFKLACTATPAPNDFMELGNHAEFMGAMTRTEMLSMFFVHDGGDTQKWRLKGHAKDDFWKWICSWAVMIRKPSDLGYSDKDFILPELKIKQVEIETNKTGDFLFQMEAKTLQERQAARRDTVEERSNKCLEIIQKDPDSQWLIWCNLNTEADTASSLIDNCINVQGSDNNEVKAKNMLKFASGDIDKLVTKPKIAGLGMNWQSCHNIIFLGLSDSFEQYYQAVRRCWRFGQDRPVNVYIVTADIEGQVVANIKRKENDAMLMADEMLKNMKDINSKEIHGMQTTKTNYKTETLTTENYELFNGDCVEYYTGIPDDSIGYTIFSPPFSSLYTYSNSERDMGNSKNDVEFFKHFKFLVDELLRVTMPGRCVSFHCMNIPAMKERDGYIGVKNFRGQLINLFESAGFIFHSEHVIWKDPLIEATRTKALGLMHKQLCKDSTKSRSGLPDYLITMKKRGDNSNPVMHEHGLSDFIGDNAPTKGVISHEIWRRYASPVWMDIRQSRTLQYRQARNEKDERHICPLQLDVIDRGLTLYSNEGDIVSSPFVGIGSEGHCAIMMGRRFKGSELKKDYFDIAVKNIAIAESESKENDLFEV